MLDFKPYRKLVTDRILQGIYGEKGRLLYRGCGPSIVVMNLKNNKKLPNGFVDWFEVIRLGKPNVVQAETGGFLKMLILGQPPSLLSFLLNTVHISSGNRW